MSDTWIGLILLVIGIGSIIFAIKIKSDEPSPGMPKVKGIVGGILFIVLGILFLIGIATWK